MSTKCVHTYVGVSLTETGGKLNPCCIFQKGNLPSIFDVNTLDNLHSSEPYVKVQKLLEQNISIPECSRCQHHESIGLTSKREQSNRMFSDEPLKYGYIQDLEIALDFTCNMMCRMCSPFASSKWGAAKEVLKKYNKENIEEIHFDTKVYKQYQEQFYKVFNNTSFEHMQHLKIEGGEPFYAKNFEWFLDKLYNEAKDRSKVHLNIFSNGSIFPNKNILKKLESFNTSITFSLDAYGDLATVIRYGVSWNKVEKSLRKWSNFSKESGINLCTNTTLSILNINMITPLSDFCKTLDIDLNYNDLHYPNYLSMYQLPLNIRETWKDDSKKHTFNQFILADTTVEQEFEKFFKSMEILDSYQKVKFKDVNPEIYSIIKEIST
jgi:molybdenum cofactor biosynthesis enzyme MoaA